MVHFDVSELACSGEFWVGVHGFCNFKLGIYSDYNSFMWICVFEICRKSISLSDEKFD